MTELDQKTIEKMADVIVDKTYELEPDDYKKWLDTFEALDFTNDKIVKKFIDENSVSHKAIE